MESHAKIPRSVIVGIFLAIVLDTIIQIFWKLAVTSVPDNASLFDTARAAMASGYFYLAMLAFSAQMFNWLRVLEKADLSFAQPFTAISYITVLAASAAMLHEHIGVTRLLGVAMIFLGVFLISRTKHNTLGSAGALLSGEEGAGCG